MLVDMEITADGRMRVVTGPYSDGKDPENIAKYQRSLDDWDGNVQFYTDYKRDGYERWVEFRAVFVGGQMVKFVMVEDGFWSDAERQRWERENPPADPVA
jgi:hypothetical protein